VTPAELTLRLTPHHAAMRGTEHAPRRCVALDGEIGKRVRCTIHPLRPSPCREFAASWSGGVHHERCDRARAAHGLPPLAPPRDEDG
jgi:Fe-S-cluster containining protein